MRNWILRALLAVIAVPAAASAQMLIGYDALGRLSCVKHQNGKLTTLSYDAAGNRTSKTVVSGSSCASQAVGPAPSLPVDISALSPEFRVASQSTTNIGAGSLGSATDSAALTLLSASAGNGVADCGSAITAPSNLTYEAPIVTPATTERVCHIYFVLLHPNGEQKGGRVTITVEGEAEGGGNGNPEDPPPCEINPQTGHCEIE